MSIGVDLDNFPALKLYTNYGFNRIIYVAQDEQDKYVKLLELIKS